MEKRREDRWELNKVNRIQVYLEEEPVTLVNLSRWGVQLLCRHFSGKNDVKVKIAINKDNFVFSGRVQWISQSNFFPSMSQIGVHLQNTSSDYADCVEKLLRIY